ncbi:PREDICTED: uncharacterized protein LOC105561408 [Vollenhovia emeryi]|uniref:uncharacterized protein LOC105561408 n=1 Tax=Vollenhovia emeryi TaxID=411798 RepID=UPI0005F41092|nr:PREDICTED: uncharacterized protein LOC105561408 [Vollenhovia emeryi]
MTNNILILGYIGRDQWIDDKSYNSILKNCSTPRQCASNILTAVFLEEILLVSTRTGFESNKKGGKKPCPKLDEIKYGACEDFYIYWMKNVYKPNKDQKKNYLSELHKFDYFIGKKISELKRPARNNESVKLPNETSKKRRKQENDRNISNKERSKHSTKYDVNDSSEIKEDKMKTSQGSEEMDAQGNIMLQQERDPEDIIIMSSTSSSKTTPQLENDVFNDSFSLSNNDIFDDNSEKADDDVTDE